MRISISAKQLKMPSVCTCCGAESSRSVPVTATRVEGKRVIRTKTSTFHFPFCARCAEHDREWPDPSGIEILLLTLLTCGLYLYFFTKRRQRVLAMCTPACARPMESVAYLGWHGTVHQFEVSSAVFAREFMLANEKKLVGADTTARAVLSTPPKPAAPPPKSAAPPPPTPASPRLVPPTPPALPSAPQLPSRSTSARGRFYGPHDEVTVADRRLVGPLAYVMRENRNADASTIVTSLRVTTSLGAEPLPYWPSYAAASPAQRAVYLDWLAGGRNDPEIAIGYVFIHFYGLERRILVDRCDEELVVAELKRLLALHGSTRSFRGYATNLIAFTACPALAALSEYTVYAHLGQIAADSELALAALLAWFHLHRRPLPPSAAALVAESMETAKHGAVVKRARAELDQLFTIRYRDLFGDGMLLEASKRPQTLEYHPGSPSLLSASRQLRIAVPGVLGKPSQFAPLVELWNGCVDDLKKLSSARRHERADAPPSREAWLALPLELRVDHEHPDQDAWDAAVTGAPRAGGVSILPAGRLAALAGIEVDERVTGARMRKAAELGAALGYAIEPDPRVFAKTLPVATELAVWRSRATDAPDATLWKSVHTMLSLTLSVALADGDVAEEEGRTVDGLIEDLFTLDDGMRTRIGALRTILMRQPARATSVAKKLKESRTAAELAKIGRVLVAVAAVDGVIVDKEHKSLKSLYKALGLPPGELAAAIVASGARLGSDDAITVAPGKAGLAGERIPAPPGVAAAGLDSAAIATLLAETREVALLLADVLDDDDDDDPRPVEPATKQPSAAAAKAPEADDRWPSLDARYHPVLRELLTRPSWSPVEVRALATRMKMMPGAILETLNSWSEETFGDLVIEEADDWRIHATILERPSA